MANVSIATVSRVINKTSPVSDEKRLRVERAVQALGYSPNPAAVSLLKGETGGIGVLVPSIGGEFFAELLLGMDQYIQSTGLVLIVSPSHRSVRDLESALAAISQRVDGLLIMSPEVPASRVARLVSRDIPIAFVNTPMDSDEHWGINIDNFGGMRAAAQHLLESGHRDVAFITGPAGAADAEQRLAGLRDAFTLSGLGDRAIRIFDADFSLESGYEAAAAIIAAGPLPTAVVAANDASAQGALRRFREAGISVPTELALIGFDDVPSARFMTPALTTVRVPIREIGVQALEWLVASIKRVPVDAASVTVPVELVIRESTLGYQSVGHVA